MQRFLGFPSSSHGEAKLDPDGATGGEEGGDAQPMMIDSSCYSKQGHFSSNDLRQDSRYPKRKRECPIRFEDEVFRRNDEGFLHQIKKKLKKLESKYLMTFAFTATRASEAYSLLDVFTDARGLSTSHGMSADCTCWEVDIEWLTLLRRLVDHPKIEVMSYENDEHIDELTSDLSLLSQEDIEECEENYYSVYYHAEKAAGWKRLKDFLLTPDAKLKYASDPANFKANLRIPYRAVPNGELSDVIEAFVSWWSSTSKEQEEAAKEEVAKKLITRICEEAQDFSDNRMKVMGYTNLDYMKLKVDVAGRVGIIDHVPEEVANFHLPGHCEWSLDDF